MALTDKILIIDDDKSVAKMLSRFLKSQGYESTVVFDSELAVEEAVKNDYNICLLDINMPGKTGIEVLEEIRRKGIFTSIIMMTGNEEKQYVIKALRAGADDYLSKPFEMEELELCIQRMSGVNYLRRCNQRYKDSLEQEVEKKTSLIKNAYFEIIKAFSNSIEMRDIYTGGHNKRVSKISKLLGEALGLPLNKQEEIQYGGMLHDIGKIGISDSILRKEGKLTDEEFIQIRKHPGIGMTILTGLESVSPFIPYVLYHHERYDGKGYPEMLEGTNIPLEGRITSLADALDAMTSKRTYRSPFTDKEAYDEILRCRGGQFDPTVVDVFKDLWSKGWVQGLLRS